MHAEILRGCHPAVTSENAILFIDQHGVGEPEALDRAGDLAKLFTGMRSCIAPGGLEISRRSHDDLLTNWNSGLSGHDPSTSWLQADFTKSITLQARPAPEASILLLRTPLPPLRSFLFTDTWRPSSHSKIDQHPLSAKVPWAMINNHLREVKNILSTPMTLLST